jgi:hypothetical protein
VLTVFSCGGGDSGSNGGTDNNGTVDVPGSNGTHSSVASASQLAQALRGKSNFMVGMGSDVKNAPNAWSLGTPLDLHYQYLVGLETDGGWPTWNPNGSYVDNLISDATAHGATAMITLYQMADQGDGNIGWINDAGAMATYWKDVRLMFQRIAASGKPVVVHLEPDFWGYVGLDNTAATGKASVQVTECPGATQDFKGLAGCLITMARAIAPKAYIGFHWSAWGSSDPSKLISMYKALGSDKTDFIAMDILDRDVGCYEAHTQSDCAPGSSLNTTYWDETNATSPNFKDNEAQIKAITSGLNLPMILWQLPFGVPSSTPGGTSGHYRDNRVHYLFGHVDEYIGAGVAGMVFGVGAQNQTYINSDNGQFKTATTQYFASPHPL